MSLPRPRSNRTKQAWYACKCVAGLGLFTALGLATVEYIVLPALEEPPPPAAPAQPAAKAPEPDPVQLLTKAWQEENGRINQNNYQKVQATEEDWLWRSRAHPVREERSRPRRILVMGDSFVWGDGYANMNDIWWRQLQRELARQGYDVEVVAAGLNGASTTRQLAALRRLLPRLQPDLVIFGYVTNDADEGLVRQLNYGVLEQDAVLRRHVQGSGKGSLFPRLNFQLEQARRKKLLQTISPDELGYPYNEWELKLIEPANLEAYARTLQSLAGFLRDSRVPYFIQTLPNYPGDSFRDRYRPVLPQFERAGIPTVNVLDAFMAAYPAGRPLANNLGWGINPANGHPGVISTRFYAVQAVEYLKRTHPGVLTPPAAPVAATAAVVNDWMPAALEVPENRAGRIRFVYPQDAALMLRMPINQEHVLFSLDMPADLAGLRLTGPDLAGATIHITRVDRETGIDTNAAESLGARTGPALDWTLPAEAGRQVNTVRVVAQFGGPRRDLELSFLPRP